MQYAYPLLAIFIWAGNTVVNKLAVGSIFPSEIGFYRWLLAALLFTPFMLKPVIAHWRRSARIWARSSSSACWAWPCTKAWRITPPP